MGSINGFGKDLQWGVDDGVGLALLGDNLRLVPSETLTCFYFSDNIVNSLRLLLLHTNIS